MKSTGKPIHFIKYHKETKSKYIISNNITDYEFTDEAK